MKLKSTDSSQKTVVPRDAQKATRSLVHRIRKPMDQGLTGLAFFFNTSEMAVATCLANSL